jgi:hypothetical protein
MFTMTYEEKNCDAGSFKLVTWMRRTDGTGRETTSAMCLTML